MQIVGERKIPTIFGYLKNYYIDRDKRKMPVKNKKEKGIYIITTGLLVTLLGAGRNKDEWVGYQYNNTEN